MFRSLRLRFAFLAPLPLALLLACAPSASPGSFEGTVLTANAPAADFRLTDQFGESVALSGFRGRVTLLTFLYTDCPDVCPIAANHLRQASRLLSEDGADVAIVVVSVDPEGDSVDAARAYSERWGMAERWSYLVGSEEALRPIWAAYYIDPYLHGPGRDGVSADSASSLPQAASGGGVGALAAQSGRIIHSAPIYLIDAAGIMRVVFTMPFETEDLVNDVRLLGG